MEKIVYVDNAATTPCDPRVVEVMTQALSGACGNPSSHYSVGYEAKEFVDTARAQVAKALNASPDEIYFTGCGSEADNWAVKGAALTKARQGKKHLITSAFEHHAILHTCQWLEAQGWQVTYLPVDAKGVVSLEALAEALREDTILVSMMHVNNEIGTIEPIEEAAKLIHEKNPKTLVHVDAIQSFGKLRIYPKRMGIDLLSVSGHKIHGPKGVGFLYVKDKTKIKPIIHGGGQQKNMRSGTENVAGIAGLGVAVEELYDNFDEKIERLYELREYLAAGMQALEGTTVNGAKGRNSAPHIVSVSFAGIRAEVLLHALEERGIYVSTGSACSSNHPAISGTLKAIGVKPELLDSTVRFSLSVESTRTEADYVLEQLAELLPILRRFRRH